MSGFCVNTRIQSIQNALGARKDCDAFLITKPANIYYASQHRGDDSCLLVMPRSVYFITDKRYSDEAERFFEKEKNCTVVVTSKRLGRAVLCHRLLKRESIIRMGFEAYDMSYAAVEQLRGVIGKKALVPTCNFVEKLRMIKTLEEIRSLEKAMDINEKVLRYAIKKITPDHTERDIVDMIEAKMKRFGADGPSFDTIVAGGMKSAFPHALSAHTKIGNNNIVLIDMGTRYQGYCSDLTRTFILSKMSRFFSQTYDKVLEAQEIAMKMLRPGVSVKTIEQTVRRFFKKHKCEANFSHALGHGIGLDVHELPVVHSENPLILEEGMVFTLEPGLYFPGEGGVRIEDVVCITRDGYRAISLFNKRKDAMVLHN